MKTKNLIIVLGILLVFLAMAPLTQAKNLGANLFYEDTTSTTKTINEGESAYIEAYGDSFEEKITSAKINIINDDTGESLELFSDTPNDVFYSKIHFLIDDSKYPGSGDYTLEFVITGEFGTQATDELSLDVLGDEETTPQVTIISPEEGDTYSLNQVNVEFEATDNENVESCSYSVNGGNEQSLSSGECSSGSFVLYDLDTGSNTLTIYATDNDGNQGSDTVSFTISSDLDNTAPSITIESPIDGEEYDTNEINITVSTDESALLEYEINGTEEISKRSLTSGYVSSYDDSIILGKGNYTLTIYATDLAGNENSKSVEFTVTSDLSEDDEDDEEESYEHKIYKKQYEPKTTEVDVSEDDRELNWWQRFINWLWELFGAEAPY